MLPINKLLTRQVKREQKILEQLVASSTPSNCLAWVAINKLIIYLETVAGEQSESAVQRGFTPNNPDTIHFIYRCLRFFAGRRFHLTRDEFRWVL